ncbi:hypothetical protein MPSEU_000617200 [Mayamaea pseudoterrestris]|nr:hypothetical protein MPSEU_000617200 [Mayamaea pseudoterrestris]
MTTNDDEDSDSDDSVTHVDDIEQTFQKHDMKDGSGNTKHVDVTQDESFSSNDEDADDDRNTSNTLSVDQMGNQNATEGGQKLEHENQAADNSDSREDEQTTNAPSATISTTTSATRSSIQSAFVSTGIADIFTEPLLKDKLHNPSKDHQGKRHSATVDKFHDPLSKDSIKNPVKIDAQQTSAFSKSGALDKFTAPLLKEKVKNPNKDYAGVRHAAVVDKITAPQLKGSVKTPPRHEWGRAPPKGKFEWVQVNGKWTKQYEGNDNVSVSEQEG